MANRDYLFGYLKKNIRGRRFQEDFELQESVLIQFKDKRIDYFSKGIELLEPC